MKQPFIFRMQLILTGLHLLTEGGSELLLMILAPSFTLKVINLKDGTKEFGQPSTQKVWKMLAALEMAAGWSRDQKAGIRENLESTTKTQTPSALTMGDGQILPDISRTELEWASSLALYSQCLPMEFGKLEAMAGKILFKLQKVPIGDWLEDPLAAVTICYRKVLLLAKAGSTWMGTTESDFAPMVNTFATLKLMGDCGAPQHSDE